MNAERAGGRHARCSPPKVDLAGVNVMAMDFGGRPPAEDMLGADHVARSTRPTRQLGALYAAPGCALDASTLWGKLGVDRR